MKTRTIFLLFFILLSIVCVNLRPIPQVKAATYTFGITDILGLSDTEATTTMIGYKATTPANTGNLSKITIYCKMAIAGNMKTAIYSGTGGSKLGESDIVAVGSSYSWVDFPFSTPVVIAASTAYCMEAEADNGYTIAYASDSYANYGYKTGITYPTFPASFTSFASYRLSIYGTYGVSDVTPPTYSDIDKSTTEMNASCLFSCKWTDNENLTTGGFIFGTNINGTFVNDTWSSFSANPSWANVTKTLNNVLGFTINFEWWCNDTMNNWNNTGVQSFAVTVTVIFRFSSYGTIERNGTAITDSTSTTYSVQTNLTMSALPTVNYSFLVWNTSYTSSTSNPYTFVVVNQTTLWCYFWDSGTWNYSVGYSVGYSDGYSAGWIVGNASGYSDGYTAGWNAGNASGYASGYSDGYSVGYSDGYIDGWNTGNATGYADGYAIGYVIGYADGLGNATGGIFIYARFTMNDTAPYQNQDTVFFNASSSNCSSLPLSYYWDFGDSSNSTGETTTHIYLNNGVFIVNLTVVNGVMSDSLLQNITVFATSINITFDWNDLLFGSGAWLPFIAIMIAMFVGVAINKWFVVAALPIMALMSFLYFDHITTTPSLVWEALIMMCSAIVLLLYSASKK